MLELINIFGMKLSMMNDWFLEVNNELSVKNPENDMWSIKKHLAVMNHWLQTACEYLNSFENGKPDETYYLNTDVISEKIAFQSENENYDDLLKEFSKNSEELILKFKNFENSSKIDLRTYLMDQFFFIIRHFGRAEAKLKMLEKSS